MSQPLRVAYAHPKDAVVIGSDGNVIFASGTTVPTDGAAGFSPGCLYIDRDAAAGSQLFINEGTASSCDFNALGASSGSFANATFTGNTTANGNTTINNAAITTLTGTTTAANNAAINTNTTGGLRIAGNNNQKLGIYGATPVVQPAGTGELVGLNGNAATAANATNMNSNGNVGSTFYTFNDLIKAAKQFGMLAS